MLRNKMPGPWIVVWGAIGIASLILPNRRAEGSPITYVFSGVINSADPSTGVAAGTPFSGSLTYDAAERPTGMWGYEGFGRYIYGQSDDTPDAPADTSGMTLQIGDQVTIDRPGGIKVQVSEIRYPGEFGNGLSSGNPARPSTSLSFVSTSLDRTVPQFGLTLSNPDRSVFGSTRPPGDFNFFDFPVASLIVADEEPGHLGVHQLYSGTIERMNVPEPTTLAIFTTAIGVLAIRRRLAR